MELMSEIQTHTHTQTVHAGKMKRGKDEKYELRGQRLYVHSLGSGTD